jgi:hypothetical protein
MPDETPSGSRETTPSAGSAGECGAEQSPLQSRAAFLENWDWQFIIGLNQRACQRGHAQHGVNSETFAACQQTWQETYRQELTLAETFAFLRQMHRNAPFLFFNGNTFAEVGRQLATALFADLRPILLREVSSATAHFIAGVFDEQSLHALIAESMRQP